MANAAAVAGLDRPAALLALATTRMRGTRSASKRLALEYLEPGSMGEATAGQNYI